MEQYTFSIAGGVARNPLVRLAQPVTAQIAAGEHIAIVGPNGGGKSLFVDTLLGKYPLREGTVKYDFSPSSTQTVYDNVKYIAFRDTYGAADANYYYQQRWNAHDQEDAPSVREMLGEIKDERLKEELFELFRIEPLLDKKIILLSSGELRKFQLTKTLLTAPRVLIMDNPFIGLDAPARELLFSLLERLTRLSSVQIILVIGVEREAINVDDVIETVNHFRCIDRIIDRAEMELTEKMIRELHLILKSGTSDSRKDWFAVGAYKKLPNEVGGMETALPEEVPGKMKRLIAEYGSKKEKTLEDILDFHVKFERIHPFQDGNGRVGRLILFKECLKYQIVPFIIEDDLKMFYYRGLKEWDREKGYLTDTCLTAQDRYKAYLDYFRIKY